MEWTREKALKLVDAYRAKPVLWSTKHADYKDRFVRHDALLDIAKGFGEEKLEIERKIKNLTSHFAREWKKTKDSKKPGSGANTTYESKWFAYKSMLFLADKRKPRQKMCTEVTTSSKIEAEQLQKEEISETIDEKLSKTEIEEIDLTIKNTADSSSVVRLDERTPSSCNMNIPKMLSPIRKCATPTTKRKKENDETYKVMKKLLLLGKSERDEFDLFGEQIAFKLRKLPTDYARIMVQHHINTILWEAELGKYSVPVMNPAYTGQNYYFPPYVQTTQFPSQFTTSRHSSPSSSSSQLAPTCSSAHPSSLSPIPSTSSSSPSP